MYYQIRKYRSSLPFSFDYVKEFETFDDAKSYLNGIHKTLLNEMSTDSIYTDETMLEYTTEDQSDMVFYEIIEPCSCESNR